MTWTKTKIDTARRSRLRLSELARRLGEPIEEVRLVAYGGWNPLYRPPLKSAPAASPQFLVFTTAGRMTVAEAKQQFPELDVIAESERLADEFGEWLAGREAVISVPAFLGAKSPETAKAATRKDAEAAAPATKRNVPVESDMMPSKVIQLRPRHQKATPRRPDPVPARTPVPPRPAPPKRGLQPASDGTLYFLVNESGDYLDRGGVGFTSKIDKAWRGDRYRVDIVKSMKVRYRDLKEIEVE